MDRRVVGWAAVAAQFAAIIATLLATGTSSGAPGWLQAVGLVVAAVGVVIAVVAFANLGRALTPTPVPNGGGLQQGGIYRSIRHPIYTGVLLVMLGVVIRSPGWWPVAWWVVLLGILSAKARWEERMLSERYEEYPQYMQRTGRFLPRL